MKSSIVFNINGSKKKQTTMFFNILTLSVAVLLLFGYVNTEEQEEEELQAEVVPSKIGLAGHLLDKDYKVTLAEGSTIVTADNFAQYKTQFPDACDVEFDNKTGDMYVNFLIFF
jgi:hypothetical protein